MDFRYKEMASMTDRAIFLCCMWDMSANHASTQTGVFCISIIADTDFIPVESKVQSININVINSYRDP